MAQYRKNILIVENEEYHFTEIKNAFENNYSDACVIYPSLTGNGLENWEDFLKEINNNSYQNVLSYYNLIDFFIIDIHLINDTDTKGADFAKTILATENRHFKIILISGDPQDYGIPDSDKVISFPKNGPTKIWAKDLAYLVCKEILNIYNNEE